MLARVALCDYWGRSLFTAYVQPTSNVTNYRTQVTGITAEHLTGAESLPFAEVQQRVAQLIQDKIITGWVPSSLAHPFPSFPNTINPVPQQISFRKFLKLWCDLFRYCIWMDLSVLGLAHPNSQIRDVALFIPFRNALGSLDQIVRLPTMIWTLMGRRIGEYTHHPMEDARAVMDLFRSVEPQWEGYIDQKEWPCYLPPNAYRSCFL